METIENIQQEPAYEQPKWPDNPWISIWFHPRETIKAIILVDPKRYVSILAAISGISASLNRASAREFGDLIEMPVLVGLIIILGGLGGIISVHISAAILSWLGGLFGGEATSEEVRSAIAWSSVPIIWGTLLWIPELALFGNEMFTSQNQRMADNPLMLLILSIIEIIIGIWAFVIFLKCLGEVHGFSAWKALLISIIPGLVIALLVFGCSLAGGGLF